MPDFPHDCGTVDASERWTLRGKDRPRSESVLLHGSLVGSREPFLPPSSWHGPLWPRTQHGTNSHAGHLYNIIPNTSQQICTHSQHTSAGLTILNVPSSPKQLLPGMPSLKVWSLAPHWMHSRRHCHWGDRYHASVFEHTNLSCF